MGLGLEFIFKKLKEFGLVQGRGNGSSGHTVVDQIDSIDQMGVDKINKPSSRGTKRAFLLTVKVETSQ